MGVDRFALDGVDIVADLDERFPIDSDSVDLLYASHSLEHVRDLMATMREVYRICKHGAQICIVAPYNEQKLNLANPYHISVFNEHTPRFWTDYPDAFIDPDEYAHPHAPHWGLSRSDHSNPGLDLRLVRMEFFYFPEYRKLSTEQQRAFRRERLDICDQVMYHLIVWKGDEYSAGRTFADHTTTFEPFEPKYVKRRKALEREELHQVLVKDLDQARSQVIELQRKNLFKDTSSSLRRVSELERDLDRAERQVTDIRGDNHNLRMQLTGLFERSEILSDQLHATKTVCSKLQAETIVFTEAALNIRQEYENSKKENQELRTQIESVELIRVKNALLKAEIEASNGLLAWYQSHEELWFAESSRLKNELTVASLSKDNWDESKKITGEVYAQMTAYRSSRMARLASFFIKASTLWDSVAPQFSELKAYSAKHFWRSSRVCFVLGDDLGSMPYREYAIPFRMDNLSKVSLAIRPLLPTSQGIVGIEIISSDLRVVAQVSLPLSGIDPDRPTDFIISAPLTDLGESWSLRVFVRGAEVPVAIYELIKYSVFRRRINYMPFVFLQ